MTSHQSILVTELSDYALKKAIRHLSDQPKEPWVRDRIAALLAEKRRRDHRKEVA
jgi:hypothetical protein